MFAATVTGAPVENACRLIKKYETEGRGYYGAALALLGRDAAGRPTADSPIVIRTADVALDGRAEGHRRAPRWCATPTRPTRSPRRTPRPAAS